MKPGEELQRIRGLIDTLGNFEEKINRAGEEAGRASMMQKTLIDELSIIYDISKELSQIVENLTETKWETTRGIAKHLKVSTTTIRKWRKDGLIPFYQPAGADCRYNVKEVDRFIKGKK